MLLAVINNQFCMMATNESSDAATGFHVILR